ncbi:MAG: hypothetical protein Q9203_001323 [Teloschistes exilis]
MEQLISRSAYWAEQDNVYFHKNVDIRPISKGYMAVYERLYDVQVALGTLKVYQPSSEQSEAQEVIEELPPESECTDRGEFPFEEASGRSWSPWDGDHDENPPDWARALEMPPHAEGNPLGSSEGSSTSVDVDQAVEDEDDEMDDVRSVGDMTSSHGDSSDLDGQQGSDDTVSSWGSDGITLVNEDEMRDVALNGNGHGAEPWVPDPDPQTEHVW